MATIVADNKPINSSMAMLTPKVGLLEITPFFHLLFMLPPTGEITGIKTPSYTVEGLPQTSLRPSKYWTLDSNSEQNQTKPRPRELHTLAKGQIATRQPYDTHM